MRKLFIYGAGGYGKEVLDLVKSLVQYQNYSLYFLDSKNELIGSEVAGVKVKDPKYFKSEHGSVVLALGNSKIKRQIVDSLPERTNFLTIVHPSVIIGRNVSIGRGCVVSAGSIISCDTVLGEFSHINFNCTIGHDSHVGDYFTAAPNVNVSGNVCIGDEVYVGTQAAIKQGISIANRVNIGMSSSVIRDVLEEGVTIYGNPARVVVKPKSQ